MLWLTEGKSVSTLFISKIESLSWAHFTSCSSWIVFFFVFYDLAWYTCHEQRTSESVENLFEQLDWLLKFYTLEQRNFNLQDLLFQLQHFVCIQIKICLKVKHNLLFLHIFLDTSIIFVKNILSFKFD